MDRYRCKLDMNSLIFQLFKTVLLSQIQFGMILYLIINLFICIPLFLTILTEISILPILTFTKYLSYRIYTSETKLTHYFKASWIYILHRNIFIIFRIYYTVLIHFLVLCTIIFYLYISIIIGLILLYFLNNFSITLVITLFEYFKTTIIYITGSNKPYCFIYLHMIILYRTILTIIFRSYYAFHILSQYLCGKKFYIRIVIFIELILLIITNELSILEFINSQKLHLSNTFIHINQNLVHCLKDIHIFTLYRNIIIIYYRFCHTILLLLILLIIILTTIIRSDLSFWVFIMQNHTKSKSSLITRIHHP